MKKDIIDLAIRDGLTTALSEEAKAVSKLITDMRGRNLIDIIRAGLDDVASIMIEGINERLDNYLWILAFTLDTTEENYAFVVDLDEETPWTFLNQIRAEEIEYLNEIKQNMER